MSVREANDNSLYFFFVEEEEEKSHFPTYVVVFGPKEMIVVVATA